MRTSTAPRAGFLVYAAQTAAAVALGAWQRRVESAALDAKDYEHLGTVVTWASYGFLALGLLQVIALVAVARVPRSTGAGRAATAAAVLTGLDVLVSLGQRVFLHVWTSSGVGDGDRLTVILRATGVVTSLVYFVGLALVLVAAVRVAQAAGARPVGWAGVAALGTVGVRFFFSVVAWVLGERAAGYAVLGTIQVVAFYASTALVVAAIVGAGLSVARVPADAAGGNEAPLGALSPGWRAAAQGISLYLGAAGARVVCALLGYAAMQTIDPGNSASLLGARDGVVAVAYLSDFATLGVLAGLWRISRAPAEAGGSGPALAALGFGAMGLVLDIVTTSITADALGGSLSAAFFAMDALPLLGALGAALGIGAAMSLLRALGNLASALGATDLAARARTTAGLAAVTGVTLGLAMVALKHMTTELLLLFALMLLPLAGATLVQFLRVALPLGSAIRART